MLDRITDLRSLAVMKDHRLADVIPNRSRVFSPTKMSTYINEPSIINITDRLPNSSVEHRSKKLKRFFLFEKEIGNKNQNVEVQSSGFSISKCLEETDAIKSALQQIEKYIDIIDDLIKASLRCVTVEEEKRLNEKLRSIFGIINVLSTKTKAALQKLKERNDIDQELAGISEFQIMNNLYNFLLNEFHQSLIRIHSIQREFRNDMKEKVARQIKFVYPDSSNEDIEEMTIRGDMSSAKAIQSQFYGEHCNLQSAIATIHDKYVDVLKLEKSINDLHQIFIEMGNLVTYQGDLINKIEYSVKKAKDYSSKADVNLVTARKYQRAAKQRICWISIIILIVGIIVLVPVLLQIFK